MGFVGWILIALGVVVPLIAGLAAGFLITPNNSSRSTPALAWFCVCPLIGLSLIVGYATTPNSACGGTGCDTGYGLGAIAIGILLWIPALIGTASGRLLRRRRTRTPDA